MEDKTKKELEDIIKEITKEAKSVVKDYADNPSEISGSTISIHDTSPYLEERWTGESWKKIVHTDNMKQMLKDVEKHNKRIKKQKKLGNKKKK